MKEYEKKIYRSRLDIDNISREGYLVEVEYGWKQNRGGWGEEKLLVRFHCGL